FLSNSSFLMHRDIVEDIGLYDPHIISSRLCDWDLWLRIFKRYPIRRAPIHIGMEHGPARKDSLGNTYPLHPECLQESFGRFRNESLRSESFPDFAVWEMPSNSSAAVVAQTITMRRFLKSKRWAADKQVITGDETKALLSGGTKVIGIF